MTKQEIKESVVEQVIDGIHLSFSEDCIGERVCIFAFANTTETSVKQKARVDAMVKILTENGYKITLNDMDIEQEEGIRKYKQSVILREKQNETNI